MGRELRRVPANWEHPRKDDGKYQPMYNEYYGDVLNDWIDDNKKWMAGTHPDLLDGTANKEQYPFYAMYHGDAPEYRYYQTKKFAEDELTHIQLYNTTSEGTPISPVFKADEFEKLCEWAADNATTFATYKATKEEWMQMLKDDFVVHREGNVIFL